MNDNFSAYDPNLIMRYAAFLFALFVGIGLMIPENVLAQRGQRGMNAPADTMPGRHMTMRHRTMMDGGMMPMMRQMHRRMMQSPLHRFMMSTVGLPALADTLNLSEEQVAQLKERRGDMQAQRQEMRDNMMESREEMMGLFEEGGQPSADVVRTHLSNMAQMRADHRAAMYESAQKMRDVLTDDQRGVLDGMTSQQYLHQVMSHMPMLEMMQMMHSMRRGWMGSCRMQGPPTMRQGKRRQGMMQQGGMEEGKERQNR